MAKKSTRDALLRASSLAKYVPDPNKRISTGCTLLNLAGSGSPDYFTHAGQYIYFVGDSSSGKTMLVLQMFAEAAANPNFEAYSLVFDNAENGALMDMEHLFGLRAAARIRTPHHGISKTAEEFYRSVRHEVRAGPCIYILDSMDALGTRADIKKQAEIDNEVSGGKRATGSYGMAKARANSDNLRDVVSELQNSGSILVIISQTRDNPEAAMFTSKKTHSGGKALDFYAHLTVWTSISETIKKSVNGIQRPIGIVCKAKLKKNRVNGLLREIQVPIYPSAGIDEIGSLIAYLLTEGHWKEAKGTIKTTLLDPVSREPISGSLEEVVNAIEEYGLESQLIKEVQTVWAEIESACRVTRKARYQ